MDSKWYKQCKKENDIVPGMVFKEPNPARMRSKIPGMNMLYSAKYGDNQWVDLERLADKKTYVATTDTYLKLQIDLDTLVPGDFIKFTDELPCMLGVTHSKTMPDGSVLSMCPSKGKTFT